MKQAKERKNRLWLWIALAAVVVAVGVVAALVLPGILGGQSQGPVGDADLYWNIDKIKYTENAEVMGMSTREPAEDGNFYVRFAHQGEQVELQVIDKQLVNVIDNLEVMGLTFDADGVVVDAIPAAQLATPMAKNFYVRSVNGNQVVINSSIAMNGMDVRFEITDKTGVWDVDMDTDPIGKACELSVFDCVHVYANAEGVATHVYVAEHPSDAEVYWRVERLYDAEIGQSTRVPDENGVYTIQCAHKGELVDLKCKDADLVREIDLGAILQGQFAFVLDEEGYIVESVDVGMALRGTYYAGDYHVTEVIDDKNYNLTKLSPGNNQGDVKPLKLAENCEIYQVCQFGCYEDHCGESIDSLQEYDRINVYSDLEGNAIMIFVTRRKVDSKMYYNLNRSYNATKQTTTRKLEGGYYVYDMLVDGKVIKVKTNNKEFADKIDARSNQCCGLDLDGNIITAVHDPVCVAGSAALGNKSPLTAIMGSVITVSDPYSGQSWNSVLAADCKVYSAVQGIYGKEVGGETTLQVGDHVTTWRNSHEEIYLAFVTSRAVEGAKVYYNLDRRYNAEAKQTRREPNEEGYYEFLMATEGKQVTVKTQSRSLATFMDSQTAPVMGLKVDKNGIVTGACEVAMAVPNGAKSCNYHYVKNLNSAAGTFSTYYIEDNVKHDSSIAQQKIAKNCKIWNVSQAYEKYRGEPSKLKDGDQIQGIIDVTTGEMIMIFIMNRDATAGFKSYNAFCKHCNKTVTWEPYAGGLYVEQDIHYYACSPYVLRQGIIGREDDGKVFDVVIDLKGKNITTMGRSLLVYDKLTIMDSVGGGKIAGTTPTESGALTTGGTIMLLSGAELNLMGGELTRSEQSTASGRIGGILYVGEKCTVNMTGGKITGGCATEQGGNIYTNGVLNISGGEISGGNAAVGANIMVAVGGSVNMSGGKVDGDFYMVSGTKATLSGAPVISGTGIQVPAGGTISVAGLRSGASIVVDADGIFTEELTNPSSYLPYFIAARQVDKIQVEGNALNYIKKRENYNGVNNGNLAFTSGSTAYCPVCKKDVAWTKLTADAITLAEGHYYLDSDITYSGSEEAYITGPGLSVTACVHLNGHNITATTGRAIEAKAGVLNVMGNGTVSGSYNDHRLFGATINMNGGNGILNLVGGTYTKNEDCKVSSVVLIRNGDVYMYDGAEIFSESNSNQCPNVQVFNRCFHLYGGKISGGTGLQVAANNWSPTVSGVVNVHGGEIIGTVMASGVGTKYGTLNVTGGKLTGYVLVNRYVNANFSGGTVEGTVNIDSKATNENSAVKVSGTAVITENGLVIPEGYKIGVGSFNSGAMIRVKATGVFTEEISNANAAKAYFEPVRLIDEIAVQGKALAYIKHNKDLNAVDNSNLTFTGNKAVCPTCGSNVTWTKLTSKAITLEANKHYYLDSDITYTGAEAAYITGPDSGQTACVHLNGHNITATAYRAIEVKAGTLNIMGNGTVSGAYNANRLYGATISTSGVNGVLNLIGGKYTKADSCNTSPVILLRNGDVNMYNGAEVYSTVNSNTLPNVMVYTNSFNLYGGKIHGGSGAQLSAANWSPTVSGIINMHGGEVAGTMVISGAETAHSTFTMDGGTVKGYVQLSRYVDAGISGGTFTGTLSIDSKATNDNSYIVFGGKPVISGSLTIPAGYKIVLSELTTGADIRVAATGAFTDALPNADELAVYFKPARGVDEIQVIDNALTYIRNEIDLNTVNNGDLVFTDNKAVCPACGDSVVWTKLTDAATTLEGGKHYYLDSDITYAGTDVAYITGPGANQTACVHLNGHNITATAFRAIEAKEGILNVMGNGTVSGAGNVKNNGATVNVGGVNGVLNLIGGTYTKADSSNTTPVVLLRGGDANMYNGATVYSTVNSNTLPNVMVFTKSFNLYGGKIHGGSGAQLSSANWSPTATGMINIHGGEVAGTMVISGADGVHGKFTMDGGTVKGYIQLSRYVNSVISGGTINGTAEVPSTATVDNSSITLSGDIKITGNGLKLPADYKINVGQLGDAASIVVSASGVFTKDITDAAAAQAHFLPARAIDEIIVEGNALSYKKNDVDLTTVSNADLVFTNNKAVCPACGDNVAWTKLTDAAVTLEDGKHYYLDADITYAGTDVAYITGPAASMSACVHLNGHNITATAFRAIEAKEGILNVMGNGTVTGAYNANRLYGATVNHSGTGGTLNLIGGTYTKADSCNTSPVVLLRGGNVNLYNAEIYSTVNSSTLPNVRVFTNTFTMYGGKISGGTGAQIAAANWGATTSGNVTIHSGEVAGMVLMSAASGAQSKLIVDGGTVTGYVELGRFVDTAISGGTFSGVVTMGANATNDNSSVAISGDVKVGGSLKLPADYKISVGQLEDAASVVVSASGVFTKDITDATAAQPHFLPSNDGDKIAVEGNTLVYVKKVTDLNAVNNADLVLTDGKAICPLCGDSVVWTKLSDAATTLEDGKHYYLDADITYAGTEAAYITGPIENQTACVHLNGHNITATAYRAIEVNKGVLNVMGNGTVSGAYNANRLYGAAVNHSGTGGTLNLIGGKYTKADSCNTSPVMILRGGDVNMYNGAEIYSTVNSNTMPNVMVYTNSFNLFGGKIHGGSGAQLSSANWSSTATGIINVHGGEIAGTMVISGANNVRGKFTMDGGSISGYIQLSRYVDSVISGGTISATVVVPDDATVDNSSVTLSGDIKIIDNGLKLPADYKIGVGQLEDAASILVAASGVFTKDITDATAAQPHFLPSGEEDKIVVEGNTLLYVKKATDLLSVKNDDLALTDSKAICPVCGDSVVWTKLTDAATTLEDGKHYYLDADITYSGTEAAYITGPAAGKTACVHLNGHNITATAYRAIEAKEGILNVMGNGTVSGAYNANRLYGATVNHSGTGGTLNLIGGTYTKAESCNTSPVVLLRGGNVNLYNAEIYSAVNSTSLPNVRVFTNTFTMYGGKISGGTGAQIAAANWGATTSGNVTIHGGEVAGMVLMSAANGAQGHLVVSGGTVTGYVEMGKFVDTAISGGTFGGTVTMGANAANDNSSVAISGNVKMTGSLKLPTGYKITLGELTAEASVNIQATGAFTVANEKAAQYAGYFHPATGYEVVAENNELVCKAA